MVDLHAEFERACSRPHEGAKFDALPELDRVLIAIWGLEADVNNGGFDQYYFNSSGDQAFSAPVALEKIGAGRMAAIVREANSLFGREGPPRDRDTRQSELAAITEHNEALFDKLNGRFYDYPDDIAALLTAYLASAVPP
jgi:hypothetical protein